MLLGVDTGGTFTDFVCLDEGRVRTHKVLSTPDAPEQAILQGVREMGLDTRCLRLVHGSTVATNAALEHKGVRTVYVTNHGLADLLAIGRQARERLYDLQPPPCPPPVPAHLCLETGGRLGPDGQVVEPLSEAGCRALARRILALEPEAVAVNLLYSWVDDRFERQIRDALPEALFVSLSSEVLPRIGEYERGIATWLNAWLGPRVQGYVERLVRALEPAPVHVMQSSGLTLAASQAGRRAVNLLLSGPAGGLMGARHVAARHGYRRLLTFDMGGTSTDVALIDGDIRLASSGRIGRWPVAVPMVDMHTIGAGGGSLARVDEGGMLAVGPESAGADPGPACYGRGGREATVTDANLVLGRLRPNAFLGGRMRLDTGAAQAALARLGARMGMEAELAARGVVELANEHMAQALRVISVQRGIDPRDFTLVAFGGAGGLHVCALAEALDMRRALIPAAAGVLSALGMLVAPRGRQLTHTVHRLLSDLSPATLKQVFAQLSVRGMAELAAEGVEAAEVEVEYSLELRYQGQSSTLTVPFSTFDALETAFHAAHRQRFGHDMDAPVELVNLRLALAAPGSELPRPAAERVVDGRPMEQVLPAGLEAPVPVWRTTDLPTGRPLDGPLLVADAVATVWVEPGWRLLRLDEGTLLMEQTKKPQS